MTKPLNNSFNIAILHIASKLFPCGYNVSPDAPASYDELRAHLNAGKRMTVFSGGSDKTIYEDKEVNYAFRAWHDWCHWKGSFDFSSEGELNVFKMQVKHIVTLYGPSITKPWIKLLHAEIVGQQEHFVKYGVFPDDQRAFVENYIA